MCARLSVSEMQAAGTPANRAWTRDTLSPADWTVPLPAAALAELRDVLAEIRRAPLPTFLLDPRDFTLDACRAAMDEVRRVTRQGPMFAVLDRLPMAELSHDEATQLYWLLSSLLARPVAQKLNGQMFYDVLDTGAKLKPGSGIRPTVTNVDLRFHNDNSYNETPPDYVCLLCLHPAKQGRRQPGGERGHGASDAEGALPRADGPPLPAVLVRPSCRASAR